VESCDDLNGGSQNLVVASVLQENGWTSGMFSQHFMRGKENVVILESADRSQVESIVLRLGKDKTEVFDALCIESILLAAPAYPELRIPVQKWLNRWVNELEIPGSSFRILALLPFH